MTNRYPSKRLVAFHEAGHQVAEYRFGFNPTGCKLVFKDGQWTGLSSSLYGSDDPRQAVALCAGYCAQVEAGDDEAAARGGSQSDFDRVAETGGTLEAAIIEAFAFVRDPGNWRAITEVARELMLQSQLDGMEIELLVDIADGEATHGDLAQYRANRDHLS
jgi:hypothetical protein